MPQLRIQSEELISQLLAGCPTRRLVCKFLEERCPQRPGWERGTTSNDTVSDVIDHVDRVDNINQSSRTQLTTNH